MFHMWESGHFSKYCTELDINDFDIIESNDTKNDWSVTGAISDFLVKVVTNIVTSGTRTRNDRLKRTCYKCGRFGHYANNCYAKTHI